MSSASAAPAKLPASVTAVNTPMPVRIRASKLTTSPGNTMTECHLKYDIGAVQSRRPPDYKFSRRLDHRNEYTEEELMNDMTRRTVLTGGAILAAGTVLGAARR